MNKSEAARRKWSRIIAAQRRSGLPVAKFCAERGISAWSLFAWKRKLKGVADQSPRPSGFVEARVRGVVGVGGEVVVELAGGRRIIVGSGFDRRVLLEVIDALEAGGARP